MKNITVAVDDEVYRAARMAAAERSTSVSALVRDYLRTLATRDGRQEEANAALFSAMDKTLGLRAADRQTRDDVHAR